MKYFKLELEYILKTHDQLIMFIYCVHKNFNGPEEFLGLVPTQAQHPKWYVHVTMLLECVIPETETQCFYMNIGTVLSNDFMLKRVNTRYCKIIINWKPICDLACRRLQSASGTWRCIQYGDTRHVCGVRWWAAAEIFWIAARNILVLFKGKFLPQLISKNENKN